MLFYKTAYAPSKRKNNATLNHALVSRLMFLVTPSLSPLYLVEYLETKKEEVFFAGEAQALLPSHVPITST